MKCKHCKNSIKASGDLWVTDVSLGEKSDVIRRNGWSLDQYRYAALHCEFDMWTGRYHEPLESSIINDILNSYGNKSRADMG